MLVVDVSEAGILLNYLVQDYQKVTEALDVVPAVILVIIVEVVEVHLAQIDVQSIEQVVDRALVQKLHEQLFFEQELVEFESIPEVLGVVLN